MKSSIFPDHMDFSICLCWTSVSVEVLSSNLKTPRDTLGLSLIKNYHFDNTSSSTSIKFYSNKVLTIVKYIKILGNSTWGLLPHQKYLLYRMCILLITIYSLSLQHYNKVLLSFSLKKLGKMQCKAALWILDTFYISSTFEIETIAGLIPVHLYLQSRHINNSCSCYFSLENMTFKQYLKIKSSIVNVNNCLNGVFSLFDSLNKEFSLVNFHFIKKTTKIKKVKLLTFTNSTKSFLIHYWVQIQSLLFWMPVLETM